MLRAKVGIGVTLTAGLLVAVAAMGKPKQKQKPVGISKAAMGVKLSSSSAAKLKKLTIIPPTPNVQANITTVAAKARLLGLNVSDLESPVRLSMSSLSFRQGNASGYLFFMNFAVVDTFYTTATSPDAAVHLGVRGLRSGKRILIECQVDLWGGAELTLANNATSTGVSVKTNGVTMIPYVHQVQTPNADFTLYNTSGAQGSGFHFYGCDLTQQR